MQRDWESCPGESFQSEPSPCVVSLCAKVLKLHCTLVFLAISVKGISKPDLDLKEGGLAVYKQGLDEYCLECSCRDSIEG